MYNKTWWESNSSMNNKDCPNNRQKTLNCMYVCTCVRACVRVCQRNLLSYREISLIPIQLSVEIKVFEIEAK